MSSRVLMAMSGGIDSGVSAMLLKQQGYELIGVTFRTFDSITESCIAREKGCCSIDSIMEAKHLAQTLGIEHHILDARQEFKDTVIKDFIDEYLQCRTPNPCVVCNKVIKWGLMMEMADKLDCQFLSTGHYARIASHNGRLFLQRGVDNSKDQTYFLWDIPQNLLQRTLFPLGNLTKTQVRQIAAENGFVKLSQKKESEEICFIPDNNYRNFLQKEVNNLSTLHNEGNFVDVDGNILGTHCGLYNYTIGQRKGLGIALGKPMYVVALDKESNSVVLGDKTDLLSSTMLVKNINMMKYDKIEDGLKVTCKVRYRNLGALAALYNDSDKIRVEFETPVESITPGQSALFYENDDVVGGGIIC